MMSSIREQWESAFEQAVADKVGKGRRLSGWVNEEEGQLLGAKASELVTSQVRMVDQGKR